MSEGTKQKLKNVIPKTIDTTMKMVPPLWLLKKGVNKYLTKKKPYTNQGPRKVKVEKHYYPPQP